MVQFHQELIVETFLWLPSKSLLRFRNLSKSFCALIDSPNFINWHLARSLQNFGQRKLIFEDRSANEFAVCNVNIDFEEEIIRLDRDTLLSHQKKDVLGYCNGLVLLNRTVSDRKPGFDLWNPSARIKYDEIARYHFKVTNTVKIIGAALGYDDSTNDYKAFFIVGVPLKGKQHEFGVQVWICGLKSKNWRMAQDVPYLAYGIEREESFPGIGYFTDGSVHWIFNKSEIVACDVRKETFSLVAQPVCSIQSMKGVSTKLHVLETCLCVSYCCRSWDANGVNQADLYTRNNKDGVDDQFIWTKVFSISEHIFDDISWFDIMKVLGYSKGGDKILLDLGLDEIVSYDVEEKSFKKLEIRMENRVKSLGFVVESLVSRGDGAKSN